MISLSRLVPVSFPFDSSDIRINCAAAHETDCFDFKMIDMFELNHQYSIYSMELLVSDPLLPVFELNPPNQLD